MSTLSDNKMAPSILKQDSQEKQAVRAGENFPLGATLYPDGVNFSIFCKNGTQVSLLLFDQVDDLEPSRVIPLDIRSNRTYHYWHIFIPGIKQGQLYGYRIHGPYNPASGHWFDPGKILLDPYSKIVTVPKKFDRNEFEKPGKASQPSMKSAVVGPTAYDWTGDRHLRYPFSQTVIYEMHVGGFTKHKSSGLKEPKRGTFAGVVEKIPYLASLGITAVELLPVFQFDVTDAQQGLANYWGYSPVSFFSLHQGYSSNEHPLRVLDEFRDMVKAFHAAGIEVFLDVVYNHTAEGGAGGPTFCFKGIDNSIYYILEKNTKGYENFSGCGNTLNANQPIVRRMIIDSLHFWVEEMHVDGFRFDLASILSRDETGHPVSNPPVLWDIETDPVLSGVKLIAEAWDAAGLYQVGHFVGDSWKEWNGKFRDDLRRFLRGDSGVLSSAVTRLVGSPDLFGHKKREPGHSINFVTCHDGFTLLDLVSYNRKYNEANREDNRDGNNENYSWNCGAEGESADPSVNIRRSRQIRNFLAITMLAVGTPMITMGDELRRTQQGNNNAYCQDNELSWLDWGLAEKNQDLIRFVRLLIESRLERDMAQHHFTMSLNELLETSEIIWHGVKLNQPDWSDSSHSIAFTVRSISGTIESHYMINAYQEDLRFELPPPVPGKCWSRWIDTSLASPEDICYWDEALPVNSQSYVCKAHSIVVLVSMQ
jgi:glycogen operon protein